MTESKRQNLLILVLWLLYTFSYVGKYSYSVNIIKVISYYDISQKQAGLVSTLFFIFYGSFQIISSFFIKKLNIKKVIFIVVIIEASVNFVLFFGVPFIVVTILWSINGIFLSLLWPCVIAVLSKNISSDKTNKAIIFLSTTTSLGTMLTYGFSALFVAFLDFKVIFIFSSIMLFLICAIWVIFNGKLCTDTKTVEEEQKTEYKPKTTVSFFLVSELAVISLFAIINSFIKDGLNLWVPSILNQNFGLVDSLSIFFTLFLSLFGIFGSFVATFLYNKLKNYSLICSIVFVVMTLLIGIILYLFDSTLWIIVLVAFCFIALMNHTLVSTVTVIAPMYLKKKINAGFLAGLLNGVTYIGSGLSSFCLGYLADSKGWFSVIYLFLALTVISAVIGVVSFIIKRVALKDASKINE